MTKQPSAAAVSDDLVADWRNQWRDDTAEGIRGYLYAPGLEIMLDLTHRIQIALDAYAREQVAMAWEEAVMLVEGMREAPMGVNTGTIWRNAQTASIASLLRARAAEGRRA